MDKKNICDSCKGDGLRRDYSSYLDIKIIPDKKCSSCYGSGISCRYTDNLVCPYCGAEESDSWEASDDDNDYQCGNCQKRFKYETEHTRTFISSPVPCLNGEDHEWKKPWDYTTYWIYYCEHCSKTKREAKPTDSDSVKDGE